MNKMAVGLGLSEQDLEKMFNGLIAPLPLVSASDYFIFGAKDIREVPDAKTKPLDGTDFYFEGTISASVVNPADKYGSLANFMNDKSDIITLKSERIMIPDNKMYGRMIEQFERSGYKGITPETLEKSYKEAMAPLYFIYIARGIKRGLIDGTCITDKAFASPIGTTVHSN